MHFNVIHISGNNVINIPQIELLIKELINQRVQLTSLSTHSRRKTILEKKQRQSNTPEFFPTEIQGPLHNPYVSKASSALEDLSLQQNQQIT